jgi:hypothetical protein
MPLAPGTRLGIFGSATAAAAAQHLIMATNRLEEARRRIGGERDRPGRV